MEIFKIIALALTAATLCAYLKATGSELFMPALVASGVAVVYYGCVCLAPALGIFTELAQKTGMGGDIIGTLIKITAVCYLIEFACGMIEDMGIKSLADKLLFVGKIIVLCMSAPIIAGTFELVVSFLSP